MDQLFEVVARRCRKADFLQTMMEKAHYDPDQQEMLWQVLEEVLTCLEEGAAWSSLEILGLGEAGRERAKCDAGQMQAGHVNGQRDAARMQEVVMTLGAGVDRLQEAWLAEGKLTEAYAAEVLGSEILLLAYAAYNQWIGENTDKVVRRYYFLGTGGAGNAMEGRDGDPLALENLPAILERSGLPVTCTEGFCMVPKKSVAFYAELTEDKAVTCEGVCMGCGREDCPNRMVTGERQQGNRVLDRPLTYGYARILGLFS